MDLKNEVSLCIDHYSAKIEKLQTQHWDECRQIALYQAESEPLYHAVKLLKLVLDEASCFKKCQSCAYEGKYIKECMGCYGDKWKWRYHEECEKLINSLPDIF